MDATDSNDKESFCRFGYVMQLLVAAINPGASDTRVAAVLYPSNSVQFANETRKRNLAPAYVFNLNTPCDEVVSADLTQLVYEFAYATEENKHTLKYPNVRAMETVPISAIKFVKNAILERSSSGRPVSAVILTDGKSHSDPDVIRRTVQELDEANCSPIIAAGIGNDVDKEALEWLVTDTSNILYEADVDKTIDLGKQIIKRMHFKGALCDLEGTSPSHTMHV